MDVQQAIRSSLAQLTPMKVNGVAKIRVGGAGDGGYVMTDDIAPGPVCYSIGVGPDVSWDVDMATNRGATVHQYDHTVDAPPARHPLCRFNKVGLGDTDDAPELRRLDTLIRANGDDDRADLILKCDIEGAEWRSLACLPQGYFGRFDQIVMELHWLDHLHDAAFRLTWANVIGNIYATHQCFHIHGNNYGEIAIVHGVPVPQVVEVSFARRAGRSFSVSDEMSPGPLDRRNREDAPDLFLGGFRF